MHRTERDMELHDKNRDGLFSFREYERPSWAYRFHDSGLTDDQMCWWKEDHFNASDVEEEWRFRFLIFHSHYDSISFLRVKHIIQIKMDASV
ncbi:uncharacterized protein [Elaeis guineensis]|uniref:uncharacterized protein isoform X3 n=1 Tax=Elaeis guineensis var. tenera TaxID=51953 RepID=UPI003C6CC60F